MDRLMKKQGILCSVLGRSHPCRVQQQACRNTSWMDKKRNIFNSRLNSLSEGSGLHLFWCAVFLYLSLSPCLAQGTTDTTTAATDSFLTTSYSPQPPVFELGECTSSFDSVDQRLYICIEHQELFPILKYAESLAKKTCEECFQNELWNCSGYSLLRQPNITKGDNVFKESAYVYALSLSVITHTVARGCAADIINNCSCSKNSGSQTACSNVEFGLEVAETFLNKGHTAIGSGLKHQLAQHNYVAAKLIIRSVLNSTDKTCHCHGISGTCTFQTCYSELPSFSVLAKRLKEAYDSACKVVSNGFANHAWISQCNPPYTTLDLIYRDETNWCVTNPEVGSVGVLNRECDPHDDAPNSCKKLCSTCGLQYKEHTVVQQTDCHCEFYFCCEIKCDVCTEQRTYYTCSRSGVQTG